MENLADAPMRLYYQIDYSLTEVPEDAAYFHAQFRRTNPVPYKDVYTIVDGIKGRALCRYLYGMASEQQSMVG